MESLLIEFGFSERRIEGISSLCFSKTSVKVARKILLRSNKHFAAIKYTVW